MQLKFAAIKRQSDFSPNHVINDSVIMMKTAEELIKLGSEITFYNEENIISEDIKENLIITMTQGIRAVKELEKKEGFFIINSPSAIMNCYRRNMVKLLPENGVPFPKSIVVDTEPASDKFDSFDARKIWVKRGDVHAVHREDVTLVYSKEELDLLLKEFVKRNIEDAVLQEHLDGDVVKFYALSNGEFFHWYYLNGKNHTPFDEKELKEYALRSAEIMGLDIFGGDAVISIKGEIKIIDINDWPSFAPVKDAVSKLIAKLIYNKAKDYEVKTK